jgi:4-amino-4-deoxy-L-arabinose transferase-like glycosyltransferase
MASAPSRPYSKADWLVIGGLLAPALAVRLPYLQLIPVISDEAFEVMAAVSVYQGNFIIFGPVNPTAGPLVTYLLALGFWLFGTEIYLPRLITMLVGVLTVGMTYVLGRAMGGRRAGLIAGLLLACSPVHTIVNSHVAWSNATTPFFVTLALTVLHAALRRHPIREARQGGRLLVLGGFLYGLALQTHISLVVAIPGLLTWFLARRDILDRLRQPWPYLAAGAAILGYGNMIAFNLISKGGTLADAQQHTYAWVSDPTWSTYWTNLKSMIAAASRTLGGQLPGIHDPISSIVAGILLAWLGAALLHALRRGETMPVFVVLSTVAIMPYVNKRYEGLLSQRYIAFLLPLCFAIMGMAAAQTIDLWRKRRWPLARAVAVGGTALALLLAFYPVRTTFAHYAIETRAGRDNAAAIYMANRLGEEVNSGTPVYLSFDLAGDRASGGRRFRRSLSYFLALQEVDHQILKPEEIAVQLETNPDQQAWLVLTPTCFEALSQDFVLERMDGSPPAPNDGHLARYVPGDQGP